MESNSLRIGNKVLLNGNTGTVTGIPNGAGAFSDVMIEVDYYGVQNNDERKDILEPVLLNNEWLLKFEFEKSNENIEDSEDTMSGAVVWRLEYFTVFQKEDKFYYILDLFTDDYGFHYRYKEVPYVHKLQNLHFAIHDKELEIK